MYSRIRLLLAVTSLAVLIAAPGTVLGRSVTPSLAPTPNTSIVLYKPPANGKPGRAVTGTLVDGVFTRKGSFTTGRWTSIAVGRDSMALYDRSTGKLLTGRFRNGIWRPVKSRTIAKGYTHVVASCDSILFYKRPTGSGQSADFLSGDIHDMRRAVLDGDAFEDDYRLLAASCDTLAAYGEDGDGDGPVVQLGLLRDGNFSDSPGLLNISVIGTHATANTSSYLQLDVPSSGAADGFWGRLSDGQRQPVSSALDFALWNIIAGAGHSVLFYQRGSGLTWGSPLEDGVYGNGGQRPSIGKGWRIIAGGK